MASFQIEVKDAVPQEQKPKSKKIFVGGLAPETTEGEDSLSLLCCCCLLGLMKYADFRREMLH